MLLTRRRFGLAAAAALTAPALIGRARAQGAARNVILMISDGAGFHTWTAASLFRHGRPGAEVFDAFPVRTLMSTHPLNTARAPTGTMTPQVGHDPAAAWSDRPAEGTVTGRITKVDYPVGFEGYDYVRQDHTDSAAAGTALSAGIKTYNRAINWTDDDRPARAMGDRVKAAGLGLGVVSSVQVSHATPAAFVAHNPQRDDYLGIAAEMILEGAADVVMGAGHPLFDADGAPRSPEDARPFRFVGGEALFERLRAGGTGHRFVDDRAGFEALAARGAEGKVFGLAPVASTLQYGRRGGPVASVPDLALMTRGALATLGARGTGFFLMVEGGAVDWACHANNLPRMIEEQIDFNRAVEAAVAWIETHGGWDETLLIVTTDHGNGMIYGPDSAETAFQPVTSAGRGALPAVRWHFDQHTNEPVPLWARGPGADRLAAAATAEDAWAAARIGWEGFGRQGALPRLDNTDVARVMAEALDLPA